MNKKMAITFGSIVLAIAIMSASTVVYFRYKNAPIEAVPVTVNEFSIPESNLSQQKEESSSEYSVPPIKPTHTVETKEVIEEPAVIKVEDTVPAPEVVEVKQVDGTVVQTPNWEAQKELASDADLKNPDKEPEYVQAKDNTPKKQAPASSSSIAEKPKASSTPKETSSSKAPAKAKSTATPKNGDTKSENGSSYMYVDGFGWVKQGKGNVQTEIKAPTTGNKVGH